MLYSRRSSERAPVSIDAPDDHRWRRPDGCTTATIDTWSIVMVALHGIVVDEAETFRAVLGRWPGASWINVGREPGEVSGVGGAVAVDAGFDEIGGCDVLVVPGSIGCESAGAESRIGTWVASRARTAHWVLASSTGTLLLARSGVDLGTEAATHWLARDQLAGYGVDTCVRPYHQFDRVVTTTGWLGARQAAMRLTEAVFDVDVARRIADEIAPSDDDDRPPRTGRRWWPTTRRNGRHTAARRR